VQEAATSPFSAWESFYVIVGSAGGALTGLQFVVIALISDLGKRRTTQQIDAFATPTIVHFCAVLLVSSILSAPWHALSSAAIAVGIFGLAGIVYTAVVMRRVSHQSGYVLVLEDWVFHTALPFLAYATVLAAALTLVSHTVDAEFGLASAMLLLIFVGVHNAWDTVTFIATEKGDSGAQETRSDAAK
jgi:hypothetical protein